MYSQYCFQNSLLRIPWCTLYLNYPPHLWKQLRILWKSSCQPAPSSTHLPLPHSCNTYSRDSELLLVVTSYYHFHTSIPCKCWAPSQNTRSPALPVPNACLFCKLHTKAFPNSPWQMSVFFSMHFVHFHCRMCLCGNMFLYFSLLKEDLPSAERLCHFIFISLALWTRCFTQWIIIKFFLSC